MLINRKHRKNQKPPCHRWRVEVGNVVVWTRNVQYGERHHRQWDSEALFFEALSPIGYRNLDRGDWAERGI